MAHGSWMFLIGLVLCSSQPAESTIHVRGAGASFPREVYNQWNSEYRQKRSEHIDIEMRYESIGSGGGKARIKGEEEPMVHYAGSDSLLTDAERQQHPNLKMIPTLVGAIVSAYNLPGVDELILSMEALTGMYNGTITFWNDSIITKLNPGVKLPTERVIVISRADKSGTTEAFTSGLSVYSNEWNETYGTFSIGQDDDGEQMRWNKSVVRFFGYTNRGMNGMILSLKYSVGYMSVADVTAFNMVYAALKNREGFVVNANLTTLQNTIVHARGSFVLMNMPGQLSYPLVAYTYFIVNMHTTVDCSSMVELVRYMNWFYHSETAREDALYFSFTPLEKTTIELIETDILQNMTCNDRNLWNIMKNQMIQESIIPENDEWRLPVYLTIGACGVVVLVMAVLFIRQQIVIHREILNNSWMIPAEKIYNLSLDKRTKHVSEYKLTPGNTSGRTFDGVYNSVAKKEYLTGVFDDQVLTLAPVTYYKLKLTLKQKRTLLVIRDSIHHLNVMRFIGLACIQSQLLVCHTGEIRMTLDVLLKNSKVTLQEKGNIAVVKSIVSGMRYLHEKGIVHGNLRAANVVIGQAWNIQIAAWVETYIEAQENVHKSNRIHPEIISNSREDVNERWAFWMAPELVKFGRFPSFNSDIYSFAMVLQEIFSRQDPYYELELSPGEIIGAIMTCCLRPKFYPETPSLIKALMEKCWCIDPNARPTFQAIEQLLKTEYPTHTSLLDTMIDSMQEYAHKLEKDISDSNKQNEITKARLEAQLTTFIPQPLAQTIATGRNVEANTLENASVMAFQITNLAELLSRTTSQGIINMLNKYYTGIDAVLGTGNVCRISRFVNHDLYLSGAPKPDRKHASIMCSCALRLLNFSGGFSIDHLEGLDSNLTIGIAIASGPVVAGVLGRNIPQYIAIGQTLTEAAQLLETTAPGTIQLSAQTYTILQKNSNFVLSVTETLKGPQFILEGGCPF